MTTLTLLIARSRSPKHRSGEQCTNGGGLDRLSLRSDRPPQRAIVSNEYGPSLQAKRSIRLCSGAVESHTRAQETRRTTAPLTKSSDGPLCVDVRCLAPASSGRPIMRCSSGRILGHVIPGPVTTPDRIPSQTATTPKRVVMSKRERKQRANVYTTLWVERSETVEPKRDKSSWARQSSPSETSRALETVSKRDSRAKRDRLATDRTL